MPFVAETIAVALSKGHAGFLLEEKKLSTCFSLATGPSCEKESQILINKWYTISLELHDIRQACSVIAVSAAAAAAVAMAAVAAANVVSA